MSDFLQFVDRIPTLPNRKKLTFENDGSVKYATVEYADEPTEEGTPLNKLNLDKLVMTKGYKSISAEKNIISISKNINIITPKDYIAKTFNYEDKTASDQYYDICKSFDESLIFIIVYRASHYYCYKFDNNGNEVDKVDLGTQSVNSAYYHQVYIDDNTIIISYNTRNYRIVTFNNHSVSSSMSLHSNSEYIESSLSTNNKIYLYSNYNLYYWNNTDLTFITSLTDTEAQSDFKKNQTYNGILYGDRISYIGISKINDNNTISYETVNTSSLELQYSNITFNIIGNYMFIANFDKTHLDVYKCNLDLNYKPLAENLEYLKSISISLPNSPAYYFHIINYVDGNIYSLLATSTSFGEKYKLYKDNQKLTDTDIDYNFPKINCIDINDFYVLSQYARTNLYDKKCTFEFLSKEIYYNNFTYPELDLIDGIEVKLKAINVEINEFTTSKINNIDVDGNLINNQIYNCYYDSNLNKFIPLNNKILFAVTLSEPVNKVDLTGISNMLQDGKLYVALICGDVSVSGNVVFGNGLASYMNSGAINTAFIIFSKVTTSSNVQRIAIFDDNSTAKSNIAVLTGYEYIGFNDTKAFKAGTRITIKEVA